jgi:predicted DNA-binding helix-hairpin-helix protein
MNAEEKIRILGDAARLDLSGDGGKASPPCPAAHCIYPAVLPGGRTTNLFKVLLTNACRYDCRYCAMRASRPHRRSRYRPEELARLFIQLRAAGRVSGLFLSSSIRGSAETTMEEMIGAVEILRRRAGYRGYVHLKVLPGASREAVRAAARLADRVSINLEAPGPDRLRALAPDKDFERDLAERLRWIGECVADPAYRARSHTTQFVVGAAGESDAELLRLTTDLYRRTGLRRAYFSGYEPPDEDSPQAPAGEEPARRQARLYQADWLLRHYRFALEDLPFDDAGRLSLEKDPKLAWAERHPERFPVELNDAPPETLLRVPGIGPLGAGRILQARRHGPLRSLTDLVRLGIAVGRARPFILLGGRSPVSGKTQLRLWNS